MTLERRLTFLPATDDTMRNGGVQGVQMDWYVIGATGAVHWTVYTNWMLSHVQEALDRNLEHHVLCHPIPVTVGYHSADQPEGDRRRAKSCDVLPGGKCFYDDSPLAAVPLFQTLVTQGSEAVWAELERRYKEQYETPNPNPQGQANVDGPHPNHPADR